MTQCKIVNMLLMAINTNEKDREFIQEWRDWIVNPAFSGCFLYISKLSLFISRYFQRFPGCFLSLTSYLPWPGHSRIVNDIWSSILTFFSGHLTTIIILEGVCVCVCPLSFFDQSGSILIKPSMELGHSGGSLEVSGVKVKVQGGHWR